jgi:hypothetical protein
MSTVNDTMCVYQAMYDCEQIYRVKLPENIKAGTKVITQIPYTKETRIYQTTEKDIKQGFVYISR